MQQNYVQISLQNISVKFYVNICWQLRYKYKRLLTPSYHDTGEIYC